MAIFHSYHLGCRSWECHAVLQPGATMAEVQTHVMEHALLVLKGQEIYRLGSDWHRVQSGDVLWLGPYCPHWFAAIGKDPALLICYSDINREPM